MLPHRYVEQLERAGAVVVVLPPRPDADDDLAAAVLERLDGLVIAGGADVEADRYDAQPHATSQTPRPDRDEWELALARVSAERDLPVLGICRGMQVMAVAAGATLDQHLPDLVGHDAHCPRPGEYTSHHVAPAEGTRLAAAARHRTGRRADLPPPGGAPGVAERLGVPAVRVARRRHPGGDGGPGSRLPPRGAVAPRGGDRRSPVRGAGGGGGGRRASDARSAVTGSDGAG